MSATEALTDARAIFAHVLDRASDERGVVDLSALLHLSTREQDALYELDRDHVADELLALTAEAQLRIERGEL